MRSRVYESQSIVLEAKVIFPLLEVGRFDTFSGIPCVITKVKHPDFKYMLDHSVVIEWHHSGLQDFSKGDKLRVYATPKGIDNLVITCPRRIDKIDEKCEMISRHFC